MRYMYISLEVSIYMHTQTYQLRIQSPNYKCGFLHWSIESYPPSQFEVRARYQVYSTYVGSEYIIEKRDDGEQTDNIQYM